MYLLIDTHYKNEKKNAQLVSAYIFSHKTRSKSRKRFAHYLTKWGQRADLLGQESREWIKVLREEFAGLVDLPEAPAMA